MENAFTNERIHTDIREFAIFHFPFVIFHFSVIRVEPFAPVPLSFTRLIDELR